MPLPTTRIRPFHDGDGDAFRELNLAWIRQHWTPEAGDWASLGQPEEKILAPGGAIFMAEVEGEAKGCCALIHHGAGRFELAKMAVDPSARGLGLGAALGEAIIAEASARGGRVLFLESNTVLSPAMGLYRKLGFKEVPLAHAAYDRCNIMMERPL